MEKAKKCDWKPWKNVPPTWMPWFSPLACVIGWLLFVMAFFMKVGAAKLVLMIAARVLPQALTA